MAENSGRASEAAKGALEEEASNNENKIRSTLPLLIRDTFSIPLSGPRAK